MSDDWWCPSCEIVLPPASVTFAERCEHCGTPVTGTGEANPEAKFWLAELGADGWPILTDGPHDKRQGVEEAAYIIRELGLSTADQQRFCVELTPVTPKPSPDVTADLALMRDVIAAHSPKGAETHPEGAPQHTENEDE